MAWRCKKCNGEVIGYGSGQFTASGALDENGKIKCFNEPQIVESQTDFYMCDECCEESTKLEIIGYWEED